MISLLLEMKVLSLTSPDPILSKALVKYLMIDWRGGVLFYFFKRARTKS